MLHFLLVPTKIFLEKIIFRDKKKIKIMKVFWETRKAEHINELCSSVIFIIQEWSLY